MRLSRTLLSCCVFASVLTAQGVEKDPRDASKVTPPSIDEARFHELRELLRPDANAPWRSVAWRIDLLAAQREAAAARKPLFLWTMDGHPLGCT